VKRFAMRPSAALGRGQDLHLSWDSSTLNREACQCTARRGTNQFIAAPCVQHLRALSFASAASETNSPRAEGAQQAMRCSYGSRHLPFLAIFLSSSGNNRIYAISKQLPDRRKQRVADSVAV
jgi:hypothetical protein